MADAVDSASARQREDLFLTLVAYHLGEVLRGGLLPDSSVGPLEATGPTAVVLPDVAVKLIQGMIDSTPPDTLHGAATRLGLAAMLEGRLTCGKPAEAANLLGQLAVDVLRDLEAGGGRVELTVFGRFTRPEQWPTDFERRMWEKVAI